MKIEVKILWLAKLFLNIFNIKRFAQDKEINPDANQSRSFELLAVKN